MPMEVLNDSGFKFGWCVGRVPPRPLTATFIVKATFTLSPDGVVEALEEDDQPDLDGDRYLDDDESRSLLHASDFALFKPLADVWLNGTAHVPGGGTAGVVEVLFGIGAWSKTIRVFGDRVASRGLLRTTRSTPIDFQRMPITWERAYGGTGFAANPIGRGIDPEQLPTGDEAVMAPNLEDPAGGRRGGLFRREEPVCFAPIPLAWPQRMGKAGTYRGRWVKECWPWFPDDFDWTLFNAAPADQQLPHFLRGDEELVLQNLHPELPVYRCRLPGLRVRWFFRQAAHSEAPLEEVRMNLDTLAVDMDAGRLTLLWRGVAGIHSLRMREVLEHFITSEPLDAPERSREEWELHLEQRKREKEAEELDEEEEEPDEGLGPDFDFPPPDESWVGAFEKEAAELEALGDKLEAERILGSKVPFPPEGSIAAEKLRAARKPAAIDDPAALRDELRWLQEEYAKPRAPVAPASAVPMPDYLEEMAAAEREIDADMASVHEAFAGEEPEEAEEWDRARVEKHAAAGGSFDDQDLDGLDLSGLDLHGASFRKASLDGANLAGTCFDGCAMEGASFSEAGMVECSLREAVCTHADFGKADLTLAVLDGAELSYADFVEAKLPGASLRGARAKMADFTAANLEKAELGNVQFEAVDLSETRLVGARGQDARLESCGIENADATEIDLSGAVLTSLQASQACLAKAQLVRAQAAGAIFEEATLDEADLSEALLAGAIFTDASLSETTLTRADARDSRFLGARCARLRAERCNLFRASFEGADLDGADLRGSNLYEAEFLDAMTRTAMLAGANLKGTKLA